MPATRPLHHGDLHRIGGRRGTLAPGCCRSPRRGQAPTISTGPQLKPTVASRGQGKADGTATMTAAPTARRLSTFFLEDDPGDRQRQHAFEVEQQRGLRGTAPGQAEDQQAPAATTPPERAPRHRTRAGRAGSGPAFVGTPHQPHQRQAEAGAEIEQPRPAARARDFAEQQLRPAGCSRPSNKAAESSALRMPVVTASLADPWGARKGMSAPADCVLPLARLGPPAGFELRFVLRHEGLAMCSCCIAFQHEQGVAPPAAGPELDLGLLDMAARDLQLGLACLPRGGGSFDPRRTTCAQGRSDPHLRRVSVGPSTRCHSCSICAFVQFRRRWSLRAHAASPWDRGLGYATKTLGGRP